MSVNKTIITKNKRGRPKKIAPITMEPLGIQPEPSGFTDIDQDTGNNKIEFIDTSYTSFQKLVNLAHKMNCEHVQFMFSQYSVEAVCYNNNSVKIFYQFKMEKIYRYYYGPGNQFSIITLNITNLQRVLSGFKKSEDNLKYFALISRLMNVNVNKDGNDQLVPVGLDITVVYTDGRRSNNRIDVSCKDIFEDLWDDLRNIKNNLDDYHLICCMEYDWIKDLLTVVTKNSNKIMFEKISAESNLNCTYNYGNNKGNAIIEYPNDAKIIHNGEIVVVSIEIADIKQLAKIRIADQIILHLSNDHPFAILANVDEKMTVMIVK